MLLRESASFVARGAHTAPFLLPEQLRAPAAEWCARVGCDGAAASGRRGGCRCDGARESASGRCALVHGANELLLELGALLGGGPAPSAARVAAAVREAPLCAAVWAAAAPQLGRLALPLLSALEGRYAHADAAVRGVAATAAAQLATRNAALLGAAERGVSVWNLVLALQLPAAAGARAPLCAALATLAPLFARQQPQVAAQALAQLLSLQGLAEAEAAAAREAAAAVAREAAAAPLPLYGAFLAALAAPGDARLDTLRAALTAYAAARYPPSSAAAAAHSDAEADTAPRRRTAGLSVSEKRTATQEAYSRRDASAPAAAPPDAAATASASPSSSQSHSAAAAAAAEASAFIFDLAAHARARDADTRLAAAVAAHALLAGAPQLLDADTTALPLLAPLAAALADARAAVAAEAASALATAERRLRATGRLSGAPLLAAAAPRRARSPGSEEGACEGNEAEDAEEAEAAAEAVRAQRLAQAVGAGEAGARALWRVLTDALAGVECAPPREQRAALSAVAAWAPAAAPMPDIAAAVAQRALALAVFPDAAVAAAAHRALRGLGACLDGLPPRLLVALQLACRAAVDGAAPTRCVRAALAMAAALPPRTLLAASATASEGFALSLLRAAFARIGALAPAQRAAAYRFAAALRTLGGGGGGGGDGDDTAAAAAASDVRGAATSLLLFGLGDTHAGALRVAAASLALVCAAERKLAALLQRAPPALLSERLAWLDSVAGAVAAAAPSPDRRLSARSPLAGAATAPLAAARATLGAAWLHAAAAAALAPALEPQAAAAAFSPLWWTLLGAKLGSLAWQRALLARVRAEGDAAAVAIGEAAAAGAAAGGEAAGPVLAVQLLWRAANPGVRAAATQTVARACFCADAGNAPLAARVRDWLAAAAASRDVNAIALAALLVPLRADALLAPALDALLGAAAATLERDTAPPEALAAALSLLRAAASPAASPACRARARAFLERARDAARELLVAARGEVAAGAAATYAAAVAALAEGADEAGALQQLAYLEGDLAALGGGGWARAADPLLARLPPAQRRAVALAALRAAGSLRGRALASELLRRLLPLACGGDAAVRAAAAATLLRQLPSLEGEEAALARWVLAPFELARRRAEREAPPPVAAAAAGAADAAANVRVEAAADELGAPLSATQRRLLAMPWPLTNTAAALLAAAGGEEAEEAATATSALTAPAEAAARLRRFVGAESLSAARGEEALFHITCLLAAPPLAAAAALTLALLAARGGGGDGDAQSPALQRLLLVAEQRAAATVAADDEALCAALSLACGECGARACEAALTRLTRGGGGDTALSPFALRAIAAVADAAARLPPPPAPALREASEAALRRVASALVAAAAAAQHVGGDVSEAATRTLLGLRAVAALAQAAGADAAGTRQQVGRAAEALVDALSASDDAAFHADCGSHLRALLQLLPREHAVLERLRALLTASPSAWAAAPQRLRAVSVLALLHAQLPEAQRAALTARLLADPDERVRVRALRVALQEGFAAPAQPHAAKDGIDALSDAELLRLAAEEDAAGRAPAAAAAVVAEAAAPLSVPLRETDALNARYLAGPEFRRAAAEYNVAAAAAATPAAAAAAAAAAAPAAAGAAPLDAAARRAVAARVRAQRLSRVGGGEALLRVVAGGGEAAGRVVAEALRAVAAPPPAGASRGEVEEREYALGLLAQALPARGDEAVDGALQLLRATRAYTAQAAELRKRALAAVQQLPLTQARVAAALRFPAASAGQFAQAQALAQRLHADVEGATRRQLASRAAQLQSALAGDIAELHSLTRLVASALDAITRALLAAPAAVASEDCVRVYDALTELIADPNAAVRAAAARAAQQLCERWLRPGGAGAAGGGGGSGALLQRVDAWTEAALGVWSATQPAAARNAEALMLLGALVPLASRQPTRARAAETLLLLWRDADAAVARAALSLVRALGERGQPEVLALLRVPREEAKTRAREAKEENAKDKEREREDEEDEEEESAAADTPPLLRALHDGLRQKGHALKEELADTLRWAMRAAAAAPPR